MNLVAKPVSKTDAIAVFFVLVRGLFCLLWLYSKGIKGALHSLAGGEKGLPSDTFQSGI